MNPVVLTIDLLRSPWESGHVEKLQFPPKRKNIAFCSIWFLPKFPKPDFDCHSPAPGPPATPPGWPHAAPRLVRAAERLVLHSGVRVPRWGGASRASHAAAMRSRGGCDLKEKGPVDVGYPTGMVELGIYRVLQSVLDGCVFESPRLAYIHLRGG